MERYGLIGRPLGHSLSAEYHGALFEQKGLDARYDNFELADIGELPRLLADIPELRGFNVTAPFKQAIIPFLCCLDAEAEAVGAVNVVKVLPDGRMKGYNSDVYGFTEALRPLINDRAHDRALILGTGGASRAVSYALERLGIVVTPVSRHKRPGVMTYGELTGDIMSEHTLIVNCTPSGTYPDVNSAPEIPYNALTDRHLCFDLVYNPPVTKFMQLAHERGAQTSNGLRMLQLQADRSQQLWHN